MAFGASKLNALHTCGGAKMYIQRPHGADCISQLACGANRQYFF
jgi:hypothetical protein